MNLRINHSAHCRHVAVALAVLVCAAASPWLDAQVAGNAQVRFVENRGQWDRQALFMADRGSMRLWFAADRIVLDLLGAGGAAHALFLRFIDAAPSMPLGSAPTAEQWNYVGYGASDRGRPSDRAGARAFRGIRYASLYPGIDLRYHQDAGSLKYDLVVAPGADPRSIRFRYEGAGSTALDRDGALRVATTVGDLLEAAPYCYQDVAGARRTVPCRFTLSADTVAFQLGEYDRTRPLVIDPVLIYSSYFGGVDADSGRAVTLDAGGNIYVTGLTKSFPNDEFPVAPGPRRTGDLPDLFVAKFDPTGGTLLFATSVHGNGVDEPTAIRIRRDGTVLVAGSTTSTDLTDNFPTRRAFGSAGGGDGFLIGLGGDGAPRFGVILGGAGIDRIEDMALGTDEAIYLTGWTRSSGFPGATGDTLGGDDAFVTKLTPAADRVVASRYLGGSLDDRASAIAHESGGMLWITGWTASSDFRAGVPRHTFGALGGRDCFITRVWFDGVGGAGEFAAVLGGSNDDDARAIAVIDGPTGADSVYITGRTTSVDFPQAGLPTSPGSWFATKFVMPDEALAYSVHVGQRDNASGGGAIHADINGNAYICGAVYSPTFPQTGSVLGGFHGVSDVAFVQLGPNGQLLHSSLIGGTGPEIPAHGSFFSALGDLYVTGATMSTDFPLRRGAYDTLLNKISSVGFSDAFLLRFGYRSHPSIVGPVSFAFDTLYCGQTSLDTLFIANNGNENLIIRRSLVGAPFEIIEPDPIGSGDSITVPPGGRLRYILRFSPKKVGVYSAVLDIHTNDPQLQGRPFSIALTAAFAAPSLNAEPVSVLFGTVLLCRDTSASLPVTISNGGVSTVTITSVSFADTLGAFGQAGLTPRVVAVKSSIRPTISFHPRTPGFFRDTLIIRVRECDTVFRIPLEGTAVRPSFEFRPGSLSFAALQPCQSSDSEVVMLVNTGSGTLHLLKPPVWTSPEFSISGSLRDSLRAGDSMPLVVRFILPKPGSGSIFDTLRIRARECGLEALLPLRGERTDTATVEVTPTTVDAGRLVACPGAAIEGIVTLVVRQHGAGDLLLELIPPPPPFTLVNPPPMPHLLHTGDSLTISIRYAPAAGGTDAAQLLLPYRSGQCVDTLRIALTGAREDLRLVPSDTLVTFDTMLACSHEAFDTITLRNPTPMPLTLTGWSGTSGASHIGPPLQNGNAGGDSISIAPNDSVRLIVRFAPTAVGDAHEALVYRWAPCNDSVVIHLVGRKEGVAFPLADDSLHFPARMSCEHDPLIEGVVVRNTDSSEPMIIRSARITSDTGFVLAGSPEGDTILPLASLVIPVQMTATVAGIHHAQLDVVIAPCGDTLHVMLDGTIVKPEDVVVIDPVAFGSVAVGDQAQRTMTIINTGSSPLRLSSLGNLAAPFSLVTPGLPVTIEPGDTLVLTLAFTPTAEGPFTPGITAEFDLPCIFSAGTQLTALGVPKGAARDTFCLADSAAGVVGDTVVLAVRATSAPRTFAPAPIDYYLRYDAERLEFIGGTVQVVVAHDPLAGLLHLREPAATSTADPQLVLRFRLLAARSPIAAVHVDSILVGEPALAAVLCSDSATIAISDRCVFINVTLAKYRNQLDAIRPNPAAAVVEVTYQQMEDARVIFRVHDAAGHEVLRPLDADLAGGRYTIRFSIATLPAGVYFYSIQAGSYHATRKMVIER